jgi:hypothetical protein
MAAREQRIQPLLGFGAGFDPVFQLDRVVDRPFVHPWPAQCAHQTLDLLLRARSAEQEGIDHLANRIVQIVGRGDDFRQQADAIGLGRGKKRSPVRK